MTETREELIERALAEYESPLIGYAYGIVHDLDRARDVVQDTFIRLSAQEVSKVRDGLKTWLFTVCRNRAFDVLRKENRLVPLEEPAMNQIAGETRTPAQAAMHDERMLELKKYLDRLPDNQREVILLKFQQGLSYKEIEEATGLSSGNIGFLIHTGLNRLRQWLPDDWLD